MWVELVKVLIGFEVGIVLCEREEWGEWSGERWLWFVVGLNFLRSEVLDVDGDVSRFWCG